MFKCLRKNKIYRLDDIKISNIKLDKLKKEIKIAAIDDNGFVALNKGLY